MTKEEIIQEAYGEYWEIHKDKINEDGWINQSILSRADFSSLQFNDKANKMRPLQLQGIEDNNGWLTMQVENENFNEWFNCWTFSDMIEYATWNPHQRYFIDTEGVIIKHVSHYQPIIKPKPPIY